MAQRSTRIRWNEDERNMILAAYQRLRTQEPQRGVAELFVVAQKALPPQRRRALNHKLQQWLQGTSKREGTARRPHLATTSIVASPVPAPASARKRSNGAPAAVAASAAPAPKPTQLGGARAVAGVPPDAAAIARVIVDMGSEILAEILANEKVRQTLRALLREAWPMTAPDVPMSPPVAAIAAESTAAAPGAPEPGAALAAVPANGKLRVLIAGMEQREGAVLAKTYDDTLDLVCWSAEDGPERLPDAVARADVVVGMTGLLSQPVEQTLRRHAKRYLRNARGVAGLRSELAGLALSGPGLPAGALA